MTAMRSRFEWSAADQVLLAIEQQNFDAYLGSRNYGSSGSLRRLRDYIAKRNPRRLRDDKGLRRSICRNDAGLNVTTGAGAFGQSGERLKIDFAALGVQIDQPLRELSHLGDAARDRDPRHRMPPQIFQHATDEIAHVDQCDFRQAIKLLGGAFGIRSSRPDNVLKAGGARDIDARIDRVDPGRARIWHDNTGRAENRQAADDAEPCIDRLGRERRAAGYGNLDLGIGSASIRCRDLFDRLADHAARHRIDRRLTRRTASPGRVTVPTPSPARKAT